MSVVADSAPLISLAAIDLLELLHTLYHVIHVPAAVYAEVVVAGKGRPGSLEVRESGWIEQRSVKRSAVSELMSVTNLDRGESEAIVLAQEMNADLFIVDDASARRYAAEHRITIVGTAGILLLAKEKDLISDVRTPLERLIRFGFYMSPTNFRKILRIAGEE